MAFYRSEVPNNLGMAISLWNEFLGPKSKQNALNLQIGQQHLQRGTQEMGIANKVEQRAEEMHGPTLETAKAAADLHRNELDKSNLDKTNRDGAIEALNMAPATLWKPTSAMTPQEFDDWKQIHFANGVTDFGTAAGAWNSTMAKTRGMAQPLQGMMNMTAQQDPAGGITVGSNIKSTADPVELDNLGVESPGGSGPSVAPGRAPTLPAVTPGGPVAPSFAPGRPVRASANMSLPDLGSLALSSPGTRAALAEAQKIRSEMLGENDKQLQMAKTAEDVNYGTAEERKAHREFAVNAAALSHRLDEYTDIVGKYGNYENALLGNPEGAAKLKSLPLDIADNWTKITNPGGVLREGLVKLGKAEQIPTSSWHDWVANKTTVAAIDQTKRVLADYIRQYENLSTTKQPVEGLTSELRKLVGPTKFSEGGAGLRTDEGFLKVRNLDQIQQPQVEAPKAPNVHIPDLPDTGITLRTLDGRDVPLGGKAPAPINEGKLPFFNSEQEFEQSGAATANVFLPNGPKGPGFYPVRKK